MGRVIGSVVVGYIVMAVVVFCLHTAAWFGLGANVAFRTGTFDPSAAWVAVTLLVGLVAALGGGWVAAIIAKSDLRALWGLIGLVVVLGILYAVPIVTRGDVASVARGDTITMMEAMQNARTPAWLALMNPVLGVVGILVGFRLRQNPSPTAVAA